MSVLLALTEAFAHFVCFEAGGMSSLGTSMLPVLQGVGIAGCSDRCTSAGTKDPKLIACCCFVEGEGAVSHQRMQQGEGGSSVPLQARSLSLLTVLAVMPALAASGEEASPAVEEDMDVEHLLEALQENLGG